MKQQEQILIPKLTPLGTVRQRAYKANSGTAQRFAKQGRVVWSSGTKVGKFEK